MPHQCTTCDRRFPDGSKEMLSGCPDCGGNKFQFAPAEPAASNGDSASNDGGNSSGTGGENRESAGSPVEPEGVKRPADSASSGSSTPGDAQSQSTRPETREWPETARRPAERDVDLAPHGGTSDERDGPAEGRDDAMEDEFEWVSGDEDTAQASARSDVVSPDELPSHAASETPTNETGASQGRRQTGRRQTDESDGNESTSTDPTADGRVVSEPSEAQPSIEQLRDELNDQFESIKIVSPGQYELNLMELYDREEHIVSLQEDGRYVINVPDSWHSDE